MKTKLVRSQAIRESQSPPRLTPTPQQDNFIHHSSNSNCHRSEHAGHSSDGTSNSTASANDSYSEVPISGQVVEIQITSGAWDEEMPTQSQMTCDVINVSGDVMGCQSVTDDDGRATGRVDIKYCVCGECLFVRCPDCSNKRRVCPAKQDSGFICSEDCQDCTVGSQGDPDLNTVTYKSNESTYCHCQYYGRRRNKVNKTNEGDANHDLTVEELVKFLKETLNKNIKDRATLLGIERDISQLVYDKRRFALTFPASSSYTRMLIHRVAELFRLRHKLEQNSTVLVTKHGTNGGKIPCQNFASWCLAEMPLQSPGVTQPQAKFILKRSSNSFESRSGSSSERALQLANRSKSLEQRELEYRKARTRIFTEEECANSEDWPWLGAPVKLLTADDGKNKLLKVKSLEQDPQAAENRLTVSKSHSFGEPPPPRILSRQGDLASSSWRLSPSSSGYNTVSFRSTPSPTAVTPEPYVWCISELSSIPAGAIIIHPQTGQPLSNPDGSIYYFDPSKPPSSLATTQNPAQEHSEQKPNPRPRGRLEKQLSINRDEISECEQKSTSFDENCEEARRVNWRHVCGKCRPNETTAHKDQSNKTIQNNSTNEIKVAPNRTNQNEAKSKPTNHVQSPQNHQTNDVQAAQNSTNENTVENQSPLGSTNHAHPEVSYGHNYLSRGNYGQKSGETHYYYQPEIAPLAEVQTYPAPSEVGQEQNLQNEMDQNQQLYLEQLRLYNTTTPVLENQTYCYENYVQSPVYDQFGLETHMQQALVHQQRSYPLKTYPHQPTLILQPAPAQTAIHPLHTIPAATHPWQTTWQHLIPQQPQKTAAYVAHPHNELINYQPHIYPVLPCYNYYPQIPVIPTQIPLIPNYLQNGVIQKQQTMQNKYSKFKNFQRQESFRSDTSKNEDHSKLKNTQTVQIQNKNEQSKSDRDGNVVPQNGGRKTKDADLGSQMDVRNVQNGRAKVDYDQKMEQVKEHFTKMGLEDKNNQQKFHRNQKYTNPNYIRNDFNDKKFRSEQQNRLSPAAQAIIDSFRNVNHSQNYNDGQNSYRDERTQNAINRIQNSLEVRSYNRNRQVGSNSWFRRGGNHSFHQPYQSQEGQSTWRR